MNFHIITLFPQIFESFTSCSLIGKALNDGRLKLFLHDLRDFGLGKHRKVDDKPFGGAKGMLLKPEPVFFAVEHIKKKYDKSYSILLDPKGERYNHNKVVELATKPSLTLVCGRYQGFDKRASYFVDESLSIGDYVLSGGEVAAMVLVETIARRIKGVIGNEESLENESHQKKLLEVDRYTRPREFMNYQVPEVLCSGYHEKIKEWEKKNVKPSLD